MLTARQAFQLEKSEDALAYVETGRAKGKVVGGSALTRNWALTSATQAPTRLLIQCPAGARPAFKQLTLAARASGFVNFPALSFADQGKAIRTFRL